MFDFIYNLQFYLQNIYFYLQFAIWFSIKTKKVDMDEIKSRWPHSLKAVINIGKLQNLLRVVFIDEECGDLKIVIDGGKLTRNINQKKNKSSHWKLSRKKCVLRCVSVWESEVFWIVQPQLRAGVALLQAKTHWQN